MAKWIPFLLEERRWTCSEAVELGKWTAIIPQRFHTFSFDATSLDSGEALTAVFLATHPLRHAAVHRLRTSVKGIERMLKNALNLATALQDKQRKCKLHDILMDFRATVQVMELNKNELENQLDEELRNIQEQRVALDKKEKEARLGMFQQDRENTTQISYQFENSIRNLTSMDESSATVVGLDKLRNPDSEEGRGDAVAGGAPGKHGVEGIHHTTGEASKPSKHGDSEFSATEAILDNNSAGDNQIATLEDTDSKSSIREDSEASTADSTGVPVQQIESDSAALLSELQPVD